MTNIMQNHADAEFYHADSGMTRFPPNVEQLSIVRESTVVWLVARRNDLELRFPLDDGDRQHLARLLLGDLISTPPAAPT
jgi:hypothetical protein